MIAVQQPAAEGDAVCLVVELLRIDLVEVVQLIVLPGSLYADGQHR